MSHVFFCLPHFMNPDKTYENGEGRGFREIPTVMYVFLLRLRRFDTFDCLQYSSFFVNN